MVQKIKVNEYLFPKETNEGRAIHFPFNWVKSPPHDDFNCASHGQTDIS